MKSILQTARNWLTRSVRRAKGLKLDSKLFDKGLKWGSKFLVPLLAFILVGLFVFLLVVIVVILFIPNPEGIYPFLGLSQENETLGLSPKNEALRFLGFGIGGTLLALGAVIANRRAKALEDTARAQVKANENSEQGLRQERLKNAIEHLADRSASVRLGGAYELFHLAKDTRDLDQTEDLSQTALDILCAHIRQTTRETEYRKKYKSEPSEEIESLLSLLFVERHEIFKDRNINLKGAFLQGANLWHARLQGANLREAKLQSVELVRAHLQGANLTGAELQDADLRSVELQGACLMFAELQGADLRYAELQGADLQSAQLQGANLALVGLQGANLVRAQLQNESDSTWSAQLQGVNLAFAHLQDANLAFAKLRGADLERVKLQGANLMGAELQGANLIYAQLQCADLGGARLQLHGVGRDIRGAELQGGTFFEKVIREKIGKESDLSDITFSGGLNQEDVDDIVRPIPDDEHKERLRERLMLDVGKPASSEPSEYLEYSDAIIGSYTKEETRRWIAEHYKTIRS